MAKMGIRPVEDMVLLEESMNFSPKNGGHITSDGHFEGVLTSFCQSRDWGSRFQTAPDGGCYSPSPRNLFDLPVS